ncbi:MAG: FAD-binding protein [Bacteroidetes bacterium]|nr:FAD-binding protein [Bacteroidota bacterium]
MPGGALKNWAGNLIYDSNLLHEPATTEEVQELVRTHAQLKVLGTRHCFNAIADSHYRFISLASFNKIAWAGEPGSLVTAEAGVRYGELADWLYTRGYALHNLASLPHISVAGGYATATHGSGLRNTNLSAAVEAIGFVSASGERMELSRKKDPDIFPGAVVHLGALGVVTHSTLRVQPAFDLRQYVFENLPLQALEKDFETIMSAGYSVSLFTSWRQKHIEEVWVKQAAGDPLLSDIFFGAAAAVKNLHPIPGIGAEHCTEQLGVPGPWHERLPHFRMGFTPSSGEELQTEYFVPLEKSWPALQAVQRLGEKIAPHLLVSEVRCIAADDLWMSPCYRQACTGIHFTWKPDWPSVRAVLPLLEEALKPFDARPHWGKLFTMQPERLSALYNKMEDFRGLLKQYDPQGKFRNDYLDTYIFNHF